MDISIFIAKILGPIFLTVSISMLLNRRFFMKAIEDYCKNAALIYFTALFAFAFGIIIVLFHNVWVANWRVIITILGWSAIIKGMFPLLFPNSVPKFMQVYQKNKTLWGVHSIIAIVFGAILTYLGFLGG